MGRKNNSLGDELASKGFRATGLPTKRELVRREEQKKILDLKGKVSWVGDLDRLRTPRFNKIV